METFLPSKLEEIEPSAGCLFRAWPRELRSLEHHFGSPSVIVLRVVDYPRPCYILWSFSLVMGTKPREAQKIKDTENKTGDDVHASNKRKEKEVSTKNGTPQALERARFTTITIYPLSEAESIKATRETCTQTRTHAPRSDKQVRTRKMHSKVKLTKHPPASPLCQFGIEFLCLSRSSCIPNAAQ